jgi:hypothetical protein
MRRSRYSYSTEDAQNSRASYPPSVGILVECAMRKTRDLVVCSTSWKPIWLGAKWLGTRLANRPVLGFRCILATRSVSTLIYDGFRSWNRRVAPNEFW